jgi:hypothetical protein
MLSIIKRQQSPQAIEAGAAFRQAYSNVKIVKSTLWAVTLFLAIGQLWVAITGNTTTDMTAIVILLLSMYVLLGSYGKTIMHHRQALGCKIQCLYDFIVLDVGVKPNNFDLPSSKIKKLKAKWIKKDADKKIEFLVNWWDKSLDEVSFPQARLICSYSTFSWELELRKKYKSLLIFILILSIGIPFFCALYFNFNMFQTLVLALSPFTPFISLVLEELLGNSINIKKAEEIRNNCKNIWNKVDNKTIKDGELILQVDSMMISWQNYRESTLPIFEWVYKVTRPAMEKDMIVDTKSLVEKIKQNTTEETLTMLEPHTV